jgi:WD40 repeat protein
MRFEPAFRLGKAYGIVFSPDESALIAVRDREVLKWDTARGQVVARASVRDGLNVDIAPDEERVLVSSGGLVTALVGPKLEIDSGFGADAIDEGPGPIVGPTGQSFVQGTWEGELLVRSTATGEVVLREKGSARMVEQICCSPDRSMFAYASLVGDAVVVFRRPWPFDANPGEEVLRTVGRFPHPHRMALGSDGRLAIQQNDRLSLWNLETGEELTTWMGDALGMRYGVAWSSFGELAATERDAGDNHRVVVRGLDAGEEWSTEVPYVGKVEYSPSSRLLAIGSRADGVLMSRVDVG